MAFGDFTVTRASTKNVLGDAGLYVSVANDTPAFEFNADGSYRGLLVEPGATNLALQSQTFDNASWTKNDATISADATASPDGATTADKLLDTIANSAHFVSQSFTASAVPYAFSCYLKASEITEAQVYIREAVASGTVFGGGTFDLSAGTILTTLAGTATIEAYPNGWYRVTVSGTATAGSRFVAIRLQKAGNTNFIGTGTDGFFIWQAQLETGSVATSPIVTTAGTASRVADVVSLTGASSLIGQSEGTIYIEHQPILSPGTASRTVINISDNSASNQVLLQYQLYGSPLRYRLVSRVSNGGVNTFELSEGNAGGLATGNVEKLAIAYKNADYATYRNGVAVVGTDTGTGTLTSIASSEIDLGNRFDNTVQLNGWIRSVALFPTRLANATLASLTA
jgi:hypothetical protein